MVISNPNKFFENAKKEHGMLKVFEFYFIFVLVSMILNTLMFLPDIIKQKSSDIATGNFLLFVIFMIIMVLVMTTLVALFSFVIYYLYHILIKIFKGKKGYRETYKLLYAATPLLLVLLIPQYGFFKLILYPLFIIAMIDTFYLEYVGLQRLQKLSKENAISVVLISAAIGVLTMWFFITRGIIL